MSEISKGNVVLDFEILDYQVQNIDVEVLNYLFV